MVGGALTTFLSWHWIFLINVPLGLAAFIAALRLVPRTSFDSGRRLDWFGLVLTTLGVGALVVGLETLGGHASNWIAVVVVGAGLASLAGAVLWMLTANVQLFNLGVFGS